MAEAPGVTHIKYRVVKEKEGGPMIPARELRFVLVFDDYEAAARLYRDVFGFEVLMDLEADGGSGVILKVPAATGDSLPGASRPTLSGVHRCGSSSHRELVRADYRTVIGGVPIGDEELGYRICSARFPGPWHMM